MYSNNISLLLIAIMFFGLTAFGQSIDGWKEEQKVYSRIHDAPLQLIDGRTTCIRQMSNQKPLVLALIFTRCTGVCNPFILRLKEQLAFREESLDFQLIVLSFDPRDELSDMEAYAKRFDLAQHDKWHFGVTSQITQLNQSIAFDPEWDSTLQQFEHDALLVGINTDGFITKKLLGIRSNRDLIRLSASINNEFAPTYRLPNKNVLFSCFNYDPQTGKSLPGLGLLFIALPGLLAFILVFTIRYLVKT